MNNYASRFNFMSKLFLLGLLLMPCELVRASSNQNSFTGSMMFAGTVIAAMFYNAYQANITLNAYQKNIAFMMDNNPIHPKLYPELNKFIKKYRCPAKLEARVNVSKFFHEVIKNMPKSKGRHHFESEPANHFAGMPGFFIKGPAIDRIVNAERMRKVIELNHLDCLRVADKCIAVNDNSLCVVGKEIVIGDQCKRLSLQETQQLFQLALQAGYKDWQFGLNLIRDIDGQLVFIDTENASYNCRIIQGSHNALFDRKVNLIHFLLRYTYFMDNDAEKWLRAEYRKLQNSVEGQEYLILLPTNSQYDAEIGIDFEQVKREFKLFEASKNKDVENETL